MNWKSVKLSHLKLAPISNKTISCLFIYSVCIVVSDKCPTSSLRYNNNQWTKFNETSRFINSDGGFPFIFDVDAFILQIAHKFVHQMQKRCLFNQIDYSTPLMWLQCNHSEWKSDLWPVVIMFLFYFRRTNWTVSFVCWICVAWNYSGFF